MFLPLIFAAAEVSHEVHHEPTMSPTVLYLLYWLFWAALLVTIVLLAAYARHAGKAEDIEFAVLITIIASSAIIISREKAVAEYVEHLPSVIGYITFVVMMIATAFLVFYAVEGRHAHH
ncbi:MAG: hypothetical protein QMC78_02905 [Methanocellales archaeon]|nr:hypothetical protein [Methanocellales archaeon]